ncbi:MAG: BppU family phage baseplate upper protein, partial [Clostridiales bacterium]|nr:BppU family phage baseplate upper protein [Clostridiales bacterium]
MKYFSDLTLPVSGEASHTVICAKQGDAGSRYLRIALRDEIVPVEIPDAARVTLSVQKPDKTSIFHEGTVENGSAVFELTSQMLAASGFACCEVNIFDEDESLLSSSKFTLEIEQSVRQDETIESSNEFSALQKMMAQYVSPLRGKTLVSFGDSIAAGQNNSAKGYAHLIAERNGMTLTSYAVSGAGVGPYGTSVLSQLQNATQTEADFVLLEGGYNDCLHQDMVPTGSISTGYDATLNSSTFCGALESLLKLARQTYTDAQIVYVI